MTMKLSPISVAILGDNTSYQSALSIASSSTAGFVSSVISAAGKMAAAAAATVAAVSATSLVTFAQFELSLSRIEGLTGVAKAQVKAYGEELMKLGPAMGKSQHELAEGLYFITSSGIKGAQALDVLTMSAKASAAGLGETKVVADAVTSAINAYAHSGLTAAQATDTLTAAVREGKAEASSFAAVMGRTMPLASSLGVSFQDVAGTMAVMTRTGASAAEAGVHVKSFLSSLTGPGKKARDTMGKTGITYGQLREIIAKPGGLVESMRLLNRVFKGSPEALHDVEPNIRAMVGMMNVLSQDAGTVDEVLQGVRNSAGDTQKAFDVASKTISFKFGQLKSVISGVFISIGESMVPGIEALERFWQNIEPIRTAVSNLASTAGSAIADMFSRINESVTVDWGNVQSQIVLGIQFIEYAILNWGDVWDLVWTSARLTAASLYNDFAHLFTVEFPKLLVYITKNWDNAMNDLQELTKTLVLNISANLAKVIANLPGLIRGTVSLEEIWTPLLDGFKSTMTELPALTQRGIGEFEQSLMDKQEAQAAKVAGGIAEIQAKRQAEKQEKEAREQFKKNFVGPMQDEALAEREKKEEDAIVGPVKKATKELAKFDAVLSGSVASRVAERSYLATLPTAMAASQMKGPSVDGQAELKKSNDLLKRIAENTKATADNQPDFEDVDLEE